MPSSIIDMTEDADRKGLARGSGKLKSPAFKLSSSASPALKRRKHCSNGSTSAAASKLIIIDDSEEEAIGHRFARAMSIAEVPPGGLNTGKASSKKRLLHSNPSASQTKKGRLVSDFFKHTKPSKEPKLPPKELIDLCSDDEIDVAQVISRAFPLRDGIRTSRRASGLAALAQSIPIDDDGYEDGSDHSTSPPSTGNSSNGNISAITVSADDCMSDADLRKWLRNTEIVEEQERKASLSIRTPLESYKGCHDKIRFTCSPGKTVQLEDDSFLRIVSVLQDGAGQIFLTGQHLVRQNFLGLKMPKRRNEVVWVVQHTDIDAREHPKLHEIEISSVRKNREVIFTDQRFPIVSARTDADSLWDSTQDVELGPLFCRWRMTVVSGPRDNVVEEAVEHFHEQDTDNKVRHTKNGININAKLEDGRARHAWRGVTDSPGGSHNTVRKVFDLDNDLEVVEAPSYTFGDAFCGAGGASRGAHDAGLFVKWGFDLDEQAIQSYYLNFSPGGTECHHEAVDVFLRRVRHHPPIVDILHISPPCQPFSHAHTIPSEQRDEINQAALFSVWHLIETIKPRVVTIEETDGLVSRHKEWFSALINIFVNLGYSVRWTALRCEQYGVPQTRKRLVVVAAGPGDRLPSFPRPTHSNDNPNLKRLATINDMISNIPANAADHDTNMRPDWVPRVPVSGDTQAKTLTCKGGDTYHPSGLRPFTPRELASLQTFPLRHSFAGARGITAAKQQIGNAVPPVFARALFREIIKSLQETDGFHRRARGQNRH